MAFVVRVAIFRTIKDDSIARAILGDANLLSFSDLLFCRLFFNRHKISQSHHGKITLFFFLTAAGIASALALVAAIYWRSSAA